VYQALYGPKGLVIFDHPYNAEYLRLFAPPRADDQKVTAGVRDLDQHRGRRRA
jgi:hypothetical protein